MTPHSSCTNSTVAMNSEEGIHVEAKIGELVEHKSHGPLVLANRYDGIDLPNDACRFLVLSGLPKAVGEYELHRANVFAGAAALSRAIAQKIEQGNLADC